MSIAILFFIFVAIMVISITVTAYNFFQMTKGFGDAIRSNNHRSKFDGLQKRFALHFLMATLCGIGSLGAFITGILWIVLYI
jgi:hypothetical protein